MLALSIAKGRASVVQGHPRPDATSGESRVAVDLCGVCATDLALLGGYMGFEGVPGHEFVGHALDGPFAGRRVVGDINAGCGTCGPCRAGDSRHCPGRTVLGILGRSGAMAEVLRLPHANLVPVPDSVSDERAVFAEPLAAALAVLESGALDRAPTRAAVVGDGRLGLLCAWALSTRVPRVELFGRHPGRELLLGGGVHHLGTALDPTTTADEPYDLVVEASGRPELLDAALGLLAPRGTLVLKTTAVGPVRFDAARLVVQELRLLGSRCGRLADALAALEREALPVERLVEARYPLSRATEALDDAGRGGRLKVLVEMPGAAAP